MAQKTISPLLPWRERNLDQFALYFRLLLLMWLFQDSFRTSSCYRPNIQMMFAQKKVGIIFTHWQPIENSHSMKQVYYVKWFTLLGTNNSSWGNAENDVRFPLMEYMSFSCRLSCDPNRNTNSLGFKPQLHHPNMFPGYTPLPIQGCGSAMTIYAKDQIHQLQAGSLLHEWNTWSKTSSNSMITQKGIIIRSWKTWSYFTT